MQINVHNFTLTAPNKATVTVQGDSTAFTELPKGVINKLAEGEALDLTGFEWDATVTPARMGDAEEVTTPAGEVVYAYTVTLAKF